MNWDDRLRSAAGELGRRLEFAHPNPGVRRRFRPLVAWTAAALIVGTAALLAWPRDPAAVIEAEYRDQIVDVNIEDPELRREFDAALAQVDRAIALAKEAVRRSPRNADFAELCRIAHRAKVRLIQAYSHGG